jgi:transposase
MVYQLSKYDLEEMQKKEKNPETKLRILGLQHFKEGKTKTWIAEACRVNPRTVYSWVKTFEAEGPDSLTRKAGQGSRQELNKEDEARFLEELEKLGAEPGRIRGKDIQELLKEKFNAEYHLNSVYRLLKKLGIVWITGRSIHPKANPEAQENFKKRISKTNKRENPKKCSKKQH